MDNLDMQILIPYSEYLRNQEIQKEWKLLKQKCSTSSLMAKVPVANKLEEDSMDGKGIAEDYLASPPNIEVRVDPENQTETPVTILKESINSNSIPQTTKKRPRDHSKTSAEKSSAEKSSETSEEKAQSSSALNIPWYYLGDERD